MNIPKPKSPFRAWMPYTGKQVDRIVAGAVKSTSTQMVEIAFRTAVKCGCDMEMFLQQFEFEVEQAHARCIADATSKVLRSECERTESERRST